MCRYVLVTRLKEGKEEEDDEKSDHVRFVSRFSFWTALENIYATRCERAFASGANGEWFACLFWTMQSRFSFCCIIAELFFFLVLALCQRERCIDFVLSFLLQYIIFFSFNFNERKKNHCKCWVFLSLVTNFSTISVFSGEITIYFSRSIDLIHFYSEISAQHRQDLKTKDWHREKIAESWEFRVKVALEDCVWRSIYVVNSILDARIIAKMGNNWVLVLDVRPLKWHTKHSPNAVKQSQTI